MAKQIDKSEWKWFGHAGHLIVGQWCRFHLCTLVGDYLISTVGEYWPERPSREIHAEVRDPKWLATNRHLRGDEFDYAYMERFGYQQIGCDRLYETMVFAAGKTCSTKDCNCGLPEINGSELDYGSYNKPGDANKGHLELCDKWADAANFPMTHFLVSGNYVTCAMYWNLGLACPFCEHAAPED